MTASLWGVLALIVVLLLLSGFFSGTETAMTGASRPRMHALEKDGSRAARIYNRLVARKDDLISTLLLANNLVNVLATSLATSVLVVLFSEAGVAYATVIMSALIIIFSEILPKTYALHNADRWALAVAAPVRLLVWLAMPLVRAVGLVTRGVFRLLGTSEANMAMTQSDEELRGAIDLHRGEDQAVAHERAMLRSILDLDDVEVADVLTHRKSVTALDGNRSVGDLVDTMLESPYTRLPVYRGDPDNIVGVAHVKAVLRQIRQAPTEIDRLALEDIVYPPWFIPESTSLLDQLQEFRRRREHFALVVDEYGSYLGIVTLEDILEEIVGEIDDEHDVPVPGVHIQGDGSVLVGGTVTIRDLNREFDWSLPDDDAATVAGLVLHEARRIPEAGQRFTFHGFGFDVLRRQRNQITRLRITPPAELAPQPRRRSQSQPAESP